MEKWENELEKVFKKEEKTDSEMLMNILTIVVFNRFNDKIGKLYKAIGDVNKFTEIVNLFPNQNLHFPDSEEFSDAILLALVYYYRKVKGHTWKQVQMELNFEKDIPLRFGKRVNCMKEIIRTKLNEVMSEEKKDDDIFSED